MSGSASARAKGTAGAKLTAPPAENLPLVTIVTPSYNHARFIRETIESVLSQDYPNIEYIVMDGFSQDGTAKVCAEYSKRLTFISEKDSGQSDAINKGFKMARGEFVAWLNSDDIFLPGAVSRAVEALQREPDIGAVYGEGYQIDEVGRVKQRFAVTEPFNLWKLVHLSDYILQQTVFFRKSVFDDVGYVDESLHYVMDWELLIRIGKRYGLRYLPYYMGSLREHGEAKTFTGGLRRFREVSDLMLRHARRKMTPGWIVYGLESYAPVWNAWIVRLFPGPFARIARKLQWFMTRVSHKIMHRVIRESQGLYSDGWAAKRLRYMLPPGHGRFLELEVNLPEGLFPRQKIAVKIAGTTIGEAAFPPGEYTIPVRLPERYWDTTVEFTVEAACAFHAPRTAQGRDKRGLCYMVRGIGYSERRAQENPALAAGANGAPPREGKRALRRSGVLAGSS